MAGGAWRTLEPALQMVASCTREAYAPPVLPHLQLRLHDLLLTTLPLQAAPALAPLPPEVPPPAAAVLVHRARS